MSDPTPATPEPAKAKSCNAQLHHGLHTIVCELPAGKSHGPAHAGAGYSWADTKPKPGKR